MSYVGNEARERALQVLFHYFQLIGVKAGVKLDTGDLRGELACVIDDIIRAAVEEVADRFNLDDNVIR